MNPRADFLAVSLAFHLLFPCFRPEYGIYFKCLAGVETRAANFFKIGAKAMIARNYPTCYELAVSHPNGTSYLVGWSSRKSRRSIDRLVCMSEERLVALTGTDRITYARRAADGATMGEWRINWTGRTEREAQHSPLPSMPDAQSAVVLP